jgi:uncharacterized repeat protein (TIGR03847 family)
MSESFEFEEVGHFTAGTVGEPGARVFYIQVAPVGGAPVSLKCEKQQVGALAEYLSGVIADLPPTEPAQESTELIEPVLAEWVAGTMSVAYDETADRIVLLIEELVNEANLDPDGPVPEPASLRMQLTRAQVAAYNERAVELVEAGRPPCPLCGHPLGVDHACPKTNGHGPPR